MISCLSFFEILGSHLLVTAMSMSVSRSFRCSGVKTVSGTHCQKEACRELQVNAPLRFLGDLRAWESCAGRMQAEVSRRPKPAWRPVVC